ncbi:MAG: 16S rRNA (cytosine(967)-C(5))-methyltransferase RsmB [Clostridia bacterium]|nr:16S rRNA (cytosine(967)-C(5))-methyltransferase RsmB [Clostridia bacterium]
MTARELVVNLLYKIEVGEAYSNTTLDKELNKSDLSREDKALASQIFYGVLTWKLTIDEIIKQYSNIRLKKISPWILNILRIAIYQIVWLDKIPVSAAVNESVNLAKKYGHPASVSFTNAILRKVSKDELDKLFTYLQKKILTEDEIIAITTSHPQWLVAELLKEYDIKFVTELLDANNQIPETTLRVNTLKTTVDEVKKLLDLKRIDCKKGNLPDSIIAKKINEFDTPLYVVQDEAAQLACIMLAPKEGELVLDACSAPGGKTTYLAQLMNNKGEIDAWDIHEHRVKLVEETAKRLGVEIISVKVNDATIYDTYCFEKYDKILLDVPCSGIGVIRKKPEIKWTRKEEDIPELVKIQAQILDNGARYLKRGGTLIYSTCTVLKQENEEQIQKFLSNHKDFELVEEKKLYPHIDNTDGFYIAKLARR